MSLKYKLGLTRNRLFEFDNAVLFCGKFAFQNSELQKALRLLCIKEPLVTSRICLEDNGEAYAVVGSVEQSVDFTAKSRDELVTEYENCGVSFFDKAFEFSYTSDGYLVIAAHTALSDARALL